MTNILLSAGHQNVEGGDPYEMALTARITPIVAQRLRTAGYDVRVIQPNDGATRMAQSLTFVGLQAVEWHRQGWKADALIELHAESNGRGDKGRGCFVIYPDAIGDVDHDVRDRIGGAIARSIQATTGIPMRGNGTMSEKSTAVGLQGYRLGVFRASEQIKATCSRMLVEVGAYSSPADKAIMDRADFPEQIATAFVQALQAFYPVMPISPKTVILGCVPQCSPNQFIATLTDRKVAMTRPEMMRVYEYLVDQAIEPAAFIALWLSEDKTLGRSALQQITNMPLNVKTLDTWRPFYRDDRGVTWLCAESVLQGCLYCVWHLKNVIAWFKQARTLEQVAIAYTDRRVGDQAAMVASAVEDMRSILARPR